MSGGFPQGVWRRLSTGFPHPLWPSSGRWRGALRVPKKGKKKRNVSFVEQRNKSCHCQRGPIPETSRGEGGPGRCSCSRVAALVLSHRDAYLPKGEDGPQNHMQTAKLRKGKCLGPHFSPGKVSCTFSPHPTPPNQLPTSGTHPQMFEPEVHIDPVTHEK